MKILFITSECAPFSKSGGLADVAFSLPPALKKLGHEVEIVTPYYKCVKQRFADEITLKKETTVNLRGTDVYCGILRGELDGVPIYFLDNEDLFLRDKLYGYDDDKYRFAFFSKACIDLFNDFDFMPDIIHCNDWEAALSIMYLKDSQGFNSEIRNVKSVFTIHNIAYQGQFGDNELYNTFGLDYGWFDGGLGYIYEGRRDVNLMKGAMLMADAVSTVSPNYAIELHTHEFGKGLEGVCDQIESKMYGILNGINMDHYDPSKDPRIPANFSAKNKKGKEKCKAYIQEEFGLRKENKWPLLCSVARLVEQKGIELIKEILPELMEKGVQLIIFGQGEQKYIDYFEECKKKYPGQFGFSSNYTEDMAAKIFAGADMYLMPSSFEPCGLSQMMAMRYGTVPIVHETGGLKDSVRAYSDFDGIGDGFSFSNYSAKALLLAIDQGIKIYFGDHKTFEVIKDRCMKKDFSWEKSAYAYEKMYSDICGSGSDPNVTFMDAYDALKVAYDDLEKPRNKYLSKQADDYKIITQVNIEGPGEGSFYIIFTKDGMEMAPYTYVGADVECSATFDNLYNMAAGIVSADKLFVNGQLKVKGNVSKGAELRYLLANLK